MALTMNLDSLNKELKKFFPNESNYIAKTWGTLLTSTPKLMSYSIDDSNNNIGTSNIYAYICLTNSSLIIITLHSMDVTRITGHFQIPLSDIQNASASIGIFKSHLKIDWGHESIRLLWINQASGTDFKSQRKQVKTICEHFKE